MHITREMCIRKWETYSSRIVTVVLNFFGQPEAIKADGVNEGKRAEENGKFWEIIIQIEIDEGKTMEQRTRMSIWERIEPGKENQWYENI